MKINKNDFDDIMETIHRSGCQFWACKGYKSEPVHMITCFRCDTIYHLIKKYSEAIRFFEK